MLGKNHYNGKGMGGAKNTVGPCTKEHFIHTKASSRLRVLLLLLAKNTKTIVSR
jgi:hypothetical protein